MPDITQALRSVRRALQKRARSNLATKLTFSHDTLMMQYRVTRDQSKRKAADLIIGDLRALHEGTTTLREITRRYTNTESNTNQITK